MSSVGGSLSSGRRGRHVEEVEDDGDWPAPEVVLEEGRWEEWAAEAERMVGELEEYVAEEGGERGRELVDAWEVEHIGSTAIPGVPAKPVIDLLAFVPDLEQVDHLLVPLLPTMGWYTSREYNATLGDRRYFRCWTPDRSQHAGHLHIVPYGSLQGKAFVDFRNALCADPDLAKAYADLKLGLAAQFGHDREAYTAAKSDFVAAHS